jgi:hypothetical protein
VALLYEHGPVTAMLTGKPEVQVAETGTGGEPKSRVLTVGDVMEIVCERGFVGTAATVKLMAEDAALIIGQPSF